MAAGLLLLLVSTGFASIDGLRRCGPDDGLGPVMAFELARDAQEVARLFGAEPCRSTLVAAQRRAIWLDNGAFIPAYALFLSLAAWGLRRGRRIAPLGVALVLAAALLDQVEGLLLWRILDRLPGNNPLLFPLYGIVRVKFALLSLAAFTIAALLVRRGRAAMVAAVVVAGGALLGLATLIVNAHHPLLTEGHRVSWIAILAIAAWFVVRPPPVDDNGR